MTSKRNGTNGKNRVDIMCETAIEASSINSMAILIRDLEKKTRMIAKCEVVQYTLKTYRMKHRSTRTIKRPIAPMIKKTSHV